MFGLPENRRWHDLFTQNATGLSSDRPFSFGRQLDDYPNAP